MLGGLERRAQRVGAQVRQRRGELLGDPVGVAVLVAHEALLVAIDATIVRAVLLPASMKLLGDWNWYLPGWLQWLPHFEHGGSVELDEPAEPLTAPPALERTG